MCDLPRHSNVIIVGAGPTGLSLALALRRLGAAPLLLDKRLAWPNTSRAGVIHAGTLEALETLGVTSSLLNEGVRVPTFRMRDRDRVLMSVNFSTLPTRFPFTLMCPQDRTEAILRDHLAVAGGCVTGGANVVSVHQSGDAVTLLVQTGEGARTISTDWLIACDGARSAVRTSVGIGFEGADYEQVFALADVRMSWPLPRSEVTLCLSGDGLMVIAPLPNDRFRIVATVDQAPDQPDAAFVQNLLLRRGPTEGGQVDEVIWSSRFHVAHRRASQILVDHVILCGDAAHVHSPAGGQGMNTGIQDAVSLAEPLAAAMQSADRSDLERWAACRSQIAVNVIALTDRMTRVASLRSRPARILRNSALSFVGRVPGFPRAMACRLAQLGRTEPIGFDVRF